GVSPRERPDTRAMLGGVVRGAPQTPGGAGGPHPNPKYKALTKVVAAVDKAKQDIIDGKVTVNTK
ncbi:hypothetical protein ACFV2H_24935, partial [Streptomyces sp. NPDC059629]